MGRVTGACLFYELVICFIIVTAVKEWHKFKTSRAGGDKKPEQHKEDMGYVNRFLAYCGFVDRDWESVTPESVIAFDELLIKTYQVGSLGREYHAIIDFWDWARQQHYIRRRQFDKVIVVSERVLLF